MHAEPAKQKVWDSLDRPMNDHLLRWLLLLPVTYILYSPNKKD